MSETFHQLRQPSLLSANSDDFNPRNNDDVPSHSSPEANPLDNNRCQDNVDSSSSFSPSINTEGDPVNNTTHDGSEESSLSSTSSDDFNPRNNDDVPSHSSPEAKTPDNNRRQDNVDNTSSSSPNIITEGDPVNNTTHDGSVESSLQKLLPSLMVTHSDVINPQDNVDISPSSEGEPLITRGQRQPAPNSQGDPDNYNVSTSGESTLPIAIITESSPLLLPTAPHQPPETFLGKSLNIITTSLNPFPLLSRARSCSALPAGGFVRARASPPPPPPGGVEQEVDNRWKLTMDNMLGLMGILAGFAIASIFSIPGGSVNTPDQVAGVGTASLLPYGYGIHVIYGLSGSTVVIILFLLLCFLGGLGGPRFSRIALLLLAEAIVSEVASLATHMLINLDCMHGQTPMWLGVVFLFVAIFVFIIFI